MPRCEYSAIVSPGLHIKITKRLIRKRKKKKKHLTNSGKRKPIKVRVLLTFNQNIDVSLPFRPYVRGRDFDVGPTRFFLSFTILESSKQ